MIQQKTGETAEYPLLSEISQALSDYIETGRPVSEDTHIFLTSHPYDCRPLKASSILHTTDYQYINQDIDMYLKERNAELPALKQ